MLSFAKLCAAVAAPVWGGQKQALLDEILAGLKQGTFHIEGHSREGTEFMLQQEAIGLLDVYSVRLERLPDNALGVWMQLRSFRENWQDPEDFLGFMEQFNDYMNDRMDLMSTIEPNQLALLPMPATACFLTTVNDEDEVIPLLIHSQALPQAEALVLLRTSIMVAIMRQAGDHTDS